MLVKILGSIIIMLCAVKIGFEEAGKFTIRVNEIRDFQTALLSLKGEISFCRTPMSDALTNASKSLKTAVAELFKLAGAELKSASITAAEAWERAVAKNSHRLSLKGDDLYIIESFGNLLGASDTAGQLENIELAMSRLSLCENQALEDERRHGRLYRSLGIIGGIVLAVIFI